MDSLKINKEFLNSLFAQAKDNPRLRQNYDLRTSEEDKSQRMLNALMPGTEVAIHRHPDSSESVICLCGRMGVVIYDEVVTYVKNVKIRQGKSHIMRYKEYYCVLLKVSSAVQYLKVFGIQLRYLNLE